MKNMYNYAATLRCSALTEKAHGKQQSFKRFDNVQCSTERVNSGHRREGKRQSSLKYTPGGRATRRGENLAQTPTFAKVYAQNHSDSCSWYQAYI